MCFTTGNFSTSAKIGAVTFNPRLLATAANGV
jgi:hypothetical protein